MPINGSPGVSGSVGFGASAGEQRAPTADPGESTAIAQSIASRMGGDAVETAEPAPEGHHAKHGRHAKHHHHGEHGEHGHHEHGLHEHHHHHHHEEAGHHGKHHEHGLHGSHGAHGHHHVASGAEPVAAQAGSSPLEAAQGDAISGSPASASSAGGSGDLLAAAKSFEA